MQQHVDDAYAATRAARRARGNSTARPTATGDAGTPSPHRPPAPAADDDDDDESDDATSRVLSSPARSDRAAPTQGQGPQLAKTLEVLATAITQIATVQVNGVSQHAALLQTLTDTSRESSQKVRATAPKLKAENADGLRTELKSLKRYFNESKLVDKRTWFKTIRSLVEGRALGELNYFVAHEIGEKISTRRD